MNHKNPTSKSLFLMLWWLTLEGNCKMPALQICKAAAMVTSCKIIPISFFLWVSTSSSSSSFLSHLIKWRSTRRHKSAEKFEECVRYVCVVHQFYQISWDKFLWILWTPVWWSKKLRRLLNSQLQKQRFLGSLRKRNYSPPSINVTPLSVNPL